MGLIRLLLAIAVLSTHTKTLFFFQFPSGSTAVRIFFVISGFYMALILNKKYLKMDNGLWLFYSNRFLRLYPLYWLILILTIVVSLTGYLFNDSPFFLTHIINGSHHPDWIGWFIIIFSNLFILLQSALSFITFYDGQTFLIHTNPQAISGNLYSLIPPAWSIGMEISFYLLAPFYAGRSWKAVALLFLFCIGVKELIGWSGLAFGPWGHRFILSGLIYFIAGVLVYKIYEKYFHRYYSKRLAIMLLALWIPTTLFNGYIFQQNLDLGYYIYAVFSAVSIPFIFQLSSSWSWDRFIGELSYPVYLSHYVCIGILSYLLSVLNINQSCIQGGGLVVTLLLSFTLLKVVLLPIERIRQKRISSANTNNSGVH
jgi:peptidoglycan/LPS O-acetylase OafA/YrhL